jgi:hypothetical protein
VKIITQSIGRNDEKHLKPLPIPFIDPPISNLHPPRLKLVSESSDIGYENRGTILTGVATIDRKSEPYAVALQYHRWHRQFLTLDLNHPKLAAVPVCCLIQVGDRQSENVVLVGKSGLERWLG